MTAGNLTRVQSRVLAALASLDPPGRLVGGAAIVGFVSPHRTTRDIDYFWFERAALGELVRDAETALRGAGFDVRSVRSAPAFHRFEVGCDDGDLVVDLVAEPFPALSVPRAVTVEGATVLVETPEELLVSKLCTLLSRQEVRDLVDVRALELAGLDVGAAVKDAPRRDSGFSCLTLAWLLREFPVARLAAAEKVPESQAIELDAYRQSLVERLLAWGQPDEPGTPR